MTDYTLTKKQQEAVENLRKAHAACRRAGVYFWDDYCTVRAVNGRAVRTVTVDPRDTDGELDRTQVTDVFTLSNMNADDTLYFQTV
jgi:hypothetical protein